MKKFVSMILVALLMMSLCTVAFAASYVYVDGTVNVRTGPGTGYASIGQVDSGSTLPYLGSSSTDYRGVVWYKVSFSGSNGWVSSTYANLTNKGGTATYAAGANNNSYAGTYSNNYAGSAYATANVYVRTGPGTGYGQLACMTAGEYATYLGNTSYDARGIAWYKVSYAGHIGWISSTYSYLTDYVYSYSSYVVANSGNTNVRTGPSLGYSSIGYLQEGESATYLGDSSVDSRGVVWYNISFNGRSAWVSSRYTDLY